VARGDAGVRGAISYLEDAGEEVDETEGSAVVEAERQGLVGVRAADALRGNIAPS
jgi:hypothetical protein